ncbi:MAG: threonine ammonia-lyase [Candidatus Rokubacteria bacterium]|nr:threonine ammonia-lyase [Candidatus Rokubacteria bacterium]
MIGIADVEAAHARIRDAIYCSPCPASATLGELTGARCHVKLENLQMTGSFKERGALSKLLTLRSGERARGVIAASAGNHGLAVAYHAQRLAIAATVVMPEWAPLIKVTQCRRHGATVVLAGRDYDEAYVEARRREAATGAVFVHPFDDPAVIAGQGTIGLELLEQVPDLDAVIVPVGGGGLIGGIAVAVKARAPRVEVIGVQAAALPSMREALERGGPVDLAPGPTIADGIAVRRVGGLTYELARRYVDEVVVVDEAEIANAILLLLEIEKTVVEGAGATTLAAVLNKKIALAGKRVVLVLSDGNIDVNIVSRVIEKGLVKDGRLVRLAVLLTDRPGALAHLCAVVAAQRANVLDIGHNRAFTAAAIGETEVVLTLETSGREQIEAIVAGLRAAGYQVEELTADGRRRPPPS